MFGRGAPSACLLRRVLRIDYSRVPKLILTASGGVACERDFALILVRAADLPDAGVALAVQGAPCFSRWTFRKGDNPNGSQDTD